MRASSWARRLAFLLAAGLMLGLFVSLGRFRPRLPTTPGDDGPHEFSVARGAGHVLHSRAGADRPVGRDLRHAMSAAAAVKVGHTSSSRGLRHRIMLVPKDLALSTCPGLVLCREILFGPFTCGDCAVGSRLCAVVGGALSVASCTLAVPLAA
jgi:hypothetical protein